MPFHFCQDELVALLAAIPFISFAWFWLRAKLGRVQRAPDCRCGHDHDAPRTAEDAPTGAATTTGAAPDSGRDHHR